MILNWSILLPAIAVAVSSDLTGYATALGEWYTEKDAVERGGNLFAKPKPPFRIDLFAIRLATGILTGWIGGEVAA